jgi:hypothetical protein
MKLRLAVFLAVGLLAVAGLGDTAWAQCAMCKTVLQGSQEGRSLQSELNRAILLMIAAPYVIFGGFVAVIFRRPLGERLFRFAARLRPGAH